jgi:putative PIN family toxin of toxin-antitoxin system
MSDKPRYVFDVNVIISALLFENSTPATAFALARQNSVVLISREIVEELQQVMSRPKFDPYINADEREVFLRSLIHEAELLDVNESIQACRDPKDDKIYFTGGGWKRSEHHNRRSRFARAESISRNSDFKSGRFHARQVIRATIIVTSSVRLVRPTNLRISHKIFCAAISAVAPPCLKASMIRWRPKTSCLKFIASVKPSV